MSNLKVKIGFVPSHRFAYTDWAQKMNDESVAMFKTVEGLELVVPSPSPDGASNDPLKGYTPTGGVQNLDMAEAVAEYFMRQQVDGLIICPLNFGDERSAAKVAEKLKVPVLLYATKEPPVHEGAAMSRVSDSYCGNLSVASALYRRKIPFHYAGIYFPDEPELKEEVETFVQAVSVIKGLTGARIGQVGVRTPYFETVGYDEVALIRKFQQNIMFTNMDDVTDKAKEYADDDPKIQGILEQVKESVPTIHVSDEYVLNAAKMEQALVDFYDEYGLSGMAVQCWPTIQRSMGISLCALFGRLTGRHMLTACETDILGTVSMMANYYASMGNDLPHFVDWTIQHRENPNWLLAWHCGNAPVCLAKNPSEVSLMSRTDMTGELPVEKGNTQDGLYKFQLKPGVVTFTRLVEYDDEWKMLIAKGKIIPSDEDLAGTWAWVEVTDHEHLYRTLVEEGFIHHASMVHGDQTKALLQVCKYLDIKPVLIE